MTDWSRLRLGARHGKLVLVAFLPDKNGGASVRCLCDCGYEREFPACFVFGKRPKYAACNINGCRQVVIKHGAKANGSVAPEYKIWDAMIQRCSNPNNIGWKRYGGRGIKVCNRWKKYQNFLKDMGRRPKGLTLGRKNNDGHYSPYNCKWETQREQANNTSTNRFLTCDGKTQTAAQWARELGLTGDLLTQRVRRGWTHERAIKEPIHQ